MSPLRVKQSDDAAAADGNADEAEVRSNPSPFIIRTYELVDDSSVDDVISWNDDGSSFILWQPAKFARDLLPKYFKHNKFSSFIRQLNIYSFRQIGSNRWEFANDCFKRGQKQLLCGIRPLASKVTVGDDDSSKMDVSRIGKSPQKGEVGISAVSSTNNQLLEKARRDLALTYTKTKRRELRKRLRKSRKQFSGDSKPELGEVEDEEETMGDNPILSFFSTDFLADYYSIDRCLDSQSLSLLLHSPDALSYCALFPPHHEFEKDTLIQLWMANGFVVHEPMERIAALFFDDCITKGYFKLSRFDLVSGNALYKLDRDNHLVSSFISRGSYIVRIEGDSNLNNVSPAVPHVSIMCATLKDSTPFHDLKRLEQLRTLMFLQGHTINFKQLPRDFLLMLRLLRVLDFSRTCLMELPSSIGSMKCLCYLDLSETLIKRLPEAITCLENLQTLKLRGCLKLSTLPKGMRKLASLHHLDFDVLHQLRSMPQGMLVWKKGAVSGS